MRRSLALAAVLCAGSLMSPGPARADAGAPSGLAVVAAGEGSQEAWPLAQAVYAKTSLRPSFDEAHARVLAGEAPASDAPKDLVDLAETRAAIRGDDAPSRRLLGSLATTLHVKGIVLVMVPSGAPPYARTFVAESGAFDAARYTAEAPDGGTPDWTSVVASLDRAYGERPVAPALATAPMPPPRDKETPSRPFYTSPWFWAAVGAAAFGGVALYFATRDNGPDTIHLQLQVPR
jgi:hypothetical protein